MKSIILKRCVILHCRMNLCFISITFKFKPTPLLKLEYKSIYRIFYIHDAFFSIFVSVHLFPLFTFPNKNTFG